MDGFISGGFARYHFPKDAPAPAAVPVGKGIKKIKILLRVVACVRVQVSKLLFVVVILVGNISSLDCNSWG